MRGGACVAAAIAASTSGEEPCQLQVQQTDDAGVPALIKQNPSMKERGTKEEPSSR